MKKTDWFRRLRENLSSRSAEMPDTQPCATMSKRDHLSLASSSFDPTAKRDLASLMALRRSSAAPTTTFIAPPTLPARPGPSDRSLASLTDTPTQPPIIIPAANIAPPTLPARTGPSDRPPASLTDTPTQPPGIIPANMPKANMLAAHIPSVEDAANMHTLNMPAVWPLTNVPVVKRPAVKMPAVWPWANVHLVKRPAVKMPAVWPWANVPLVKLLQPPTPATYEAPIDMPIDTPTTINADEAPTATNADPLMNTEAATNLRIIQSLWPARPRRLIRFSPEDREYMVEILERTKDRRPGKDMIKQMAIHINCTVQQVYTFGCNYRKDIKFPEARKGRKSKVIHT